MYHPDPLGRNSAGNQIIAGTFTYGVKPGPPIGPRQRPFSQPDDRCRGPGRLLICRGAEQVRYDGTEWKGAEAREEKRKLVDVLDDDVGSLFGDCPPHRSASCQSKSVPAGDPPNLDAIDDCG
jgi:hypothetical protein